MMSPVARSVYRFLLLTGLFFVILPPPYRHQVVDYVRQTNPLSGQRSIELAFKPTEAELACLHGYPLPGEPANETSDPIPNDVHFIFGLANPLLDPHAGRFGFLDYLAVRSGLLSLRPDHLYLHYSYLSDPPSPSPYANPFANPWIRRLAKNITLVHHPPPPLATHPSSPSSPLLASSSGYAHASDALRLRILHARGGIYLDIDAFSLRPFTRFLNPPRPHDAVLGFEGGSRWGLCNAVIAARRNSSFVARWLDAYSEDEDILGGSDLKLKRKREREKGWNELSVRLPARLAARYPREVCALPPDAFFWPTWTWRHVRWMHERLSAEEAAYWEGEIARNGGLFANQMVYHAWRQMAWGRYLRGLTPKVVRERDTRFNLLVRRFLEDDL
jgi:hypothetical protein